MFIGPRWLQGVVLLLLFLGVLEATPKLVVWEDSPFVKGSGSPSDTSFLGESELVGYLSSRGYQVSISMSEAVRSLLEKPSNYTSLAIIVAGSKTCSDSVLGEYKRLLELAAREAKTITVVVGGEDECYKRVLEASGVEKTPELGPLLVASGGLKAIPVMYDEGEVFVGYTVRGFSSTPIGWHPEAISMDPPGRIVAASTSIVVSLGNKTIRETYYLVGDGDLFRNILFSNNRTGVKNLLDYFLSSSGVEPRGSLVVVPLEFFLGSTPLDLARLNPTALFHPGVFALAILQLYLGAEQSFLEFLEKTPFFLLAFFAATSLLVYSLLSRRIEERIVVFKPSKPPEGIVFYAPSPILRKLVAGEPLSRDEAREAVLGLYEIVDSILSKRLGAKLEEIARSREKLEELARLTGLSRKIAEKRLQRLVSLKLKAERKKFFPLVVSWKRSLNKAVEEVEPILRPLGVSLKEIRGVERELIH